MQLASRMAATRPPARPFARGVRLLQDQVALRQAEIDRARAAIQVGAEQLAQGRTVDGDAFFTEWDADLDELEAAGRHHHEV